VLGLVGDALERRAKVDARAHHHRELRGEVQHVLGLGLAGVELVEPLDISLSLSSPADAGWIASPAGPGRAASVAADSMHSLESTPDCALPPVLDLILVTGIEVSRFYQPFGASGRQLRSSLSG
jgi:hypothetical protein